jgi:hypothetical protein
MQTKALTPDEISEMIQEVGPRDKQRRNTHFLGGQIGRVEGIDVPSLQGYLGHQICSPDHRLPEQAVASAVAAGVGCLGVTGSHCQDGCHDVAGVPGSYLWLQDSFPLR